MIIVKMHLSIVLDIKYCPKMFLIYILKIKKTQYIQERFRYRTLYASGISINFC